MPPLWFSNVDGLVLFLAIVGGSQCFDQVCAWEGCLHMWFVVIVKVFQSYIFMICLDPMNNYTCEHFQVFSNAVENNSTTHPRLGYWPQQWYGNIFFSYG